MTGNRTPLRGATVVALAIFLFLAACDTAEERADGHYQSALSLLEDGDVARAKVELRTVFSLVPNHRDARETFARILLDEGDYNAAFGQYMRLVEETPDAVEPRFVVAELLMLGADFDAAQEHLTQVQSRAPEDARTRILTNVDAYRSAVVAEDVGARRDAAARAVELSKEIPGSLVNNFVIADSMVLDENYAALLEELDRSQALAPDERRLYQFRLTAYGRLNDGDGLEATLRDMIETFPDDENLPETLMRFYASQGDLDGAETFLRSRYEEGIQDDGARLTLVRFLAAARGPEVALAEVQKLEDEGTNAELFRSLRASLLYDTGARQEALDLYEGIVTSAEPSAQANNIKASYASLLQREGNEVGARALIEEVLAEDPSHVASLLMRAAWLIEDDRADDAIVALRVAQDQDPENPTIFTDLAEAHLRNGERDLAGEMLSLAAESSNRAPRESIVYARFLISEGRLRPAEAVLIDALRLAPGRLDLLVELGDLYVRMEDWGRMAGVESEMREQRSQAAIAAADTLRLNSLREQGRAGEAVAFLEGLTNDSRAGLAADIAIYQTLLQEGDTQGALEHIEGLLAQNADDPTLRFFMGSAQSANGNPVQAVATFRELIASGATGERIWIELIRALNLSGDRDAAEAALDEALAVVPGSADLQWAKASVLERDGQFDGAIAIYEDLYERNSNSPIIANNLASLLSTVRQDEASLERADRIARRLRGTEVPAFQDTYGWVQYLRGNYDEAVTYLEPAAQALQTDAMVQAHLGLALAALDRADEAVEQLTRALEMAGDDPRPAFDTARTRLVELQNRDTATGTSE